MTHEEVQQWLDDYISAWASNDPEDIGKLFTENSEYSYRPWKSESQTVTGREAIVESWLEDPDDPSLWEAAYAPYVVEGDKAVAIGWTKCHPTGEHPERTYHNAYLLRFEDGACAEFAEFYILEKD